MPSSPPIHRILPALAVAWLVAAVAVATKLHLATGLDAGVDLAVGAALVAPDVRAAVLLAAVGSLLLGLADGGVHRVVSVVLGLFGAFVTVVQLSAYSFFSTTGSPLDFPMIAYTTDNFAMLKDVLASELNGTVLAGAGALIGTFLTVALAAGPRPSKVRHSATIAGLVAFLIATVAVHIPGNAIIKGRLQLLRPQPVVHIAGGALSAWRGEEPTHSEASATEPILPLVVRRGPATKPYNVVLIGLESAGAHALTTYNPKLATMPFLDKLARKGVIVERSYAPVPHTTKALVPIHCGVLPQVAAGYHESTPGAIPTDCLARVLDRFGYATAYFQSSESYFERQRDLTAQFGFQDFFALKEIRQFYAGAGNPIPTHPRAKSGPWEVVNYFGLEDKSMVAPSLDWIDKQRAVAPDKPFFMAYITLISHHDYGLPSTWKVRDFVSNSTHNNYLNALRYTDEFIADLHAGLAKRGLLDNTLFVFVGDHGEGFGEHGVYQHDAVLFEEGIRVPFILHGAGVPQTGKRIGGIRNHTDVMPTILDALGLDVIAGTIDGRSVLSTAGRTEQPLSCWYKNRCMGVIKAARSASGADTLTKTIWHYGKRDPEVYELRGDPEEKTDLFGQPGHTKADIDKRVAKLKAWKADINARYAQQAKRRKSPWVRTSKPAIGEDATIEFDGIVRLVKWQFDAKTVQAGEAIWATYVFEVLKKPPASWRLFVHADGPGGALDKADHVPVEGSYPIAQWQPGEFIVDRNYIRFDPGVESGMWRISIGFWDHNTGKRAVPLGIGRTITANRKVDKTPVPTIVHDWLWTRRSGDSTVVSVFLLKKMTRIGPTG